jgi:hypothetical protein
METQAIKAIIESFTGSANMGYQSVGEAHFDELAKVLKDEMYNIDANEIKESKTLILRTITNEGDKAKFYVNVIGTSRANAALFVTRLTLTKSQDYFRILEQKLVKPLDSKTYLFRTRFAIRLDTLQFIIEWMKKEKIVK